MWPESISLSVCVCVCVCAWNGAILSPGYPLVSFVWFLTPHGISAALELNLTHTHTLLPFFRIDLLAAAAIQSTPPGIRRGLCRPPYSSAPCVTSIKMTCVHSNAPFCRFQFPAGLADASQASGSTIRGPESSVAYGIRRATATDSEDHFFIKMRLLLGSSMVVKGQVEHGFQFVGGTKLI